MREWRAAGGDGPEAERKRARARGRALRRLASLRKALYERLYAEELEKES